jgi:hypothetical protein
MNIKIWGTKSLIATTWSHKPRVYTICPEKKTIKKVHISRGTEGHLFLRWQALKMKDVQDFSS